MAKAAVVSVFGFCMVIPDKDSVVSPESVKAWIK